MLNHIFTFGLLTVAIRVLLRDPKTNELRTSIDELTFELDYVRDEHGKKISVTPEMLDSIEGYFLAMLPAVLAKVDVSVLNAGVNNLSGAGEEIDDWTKWHEAATRIADEQGWTYDTCEVKVRHASLKQAALASSEAKRFMDERLEVLADRYDNGARRSVRNGSHSATVQAYRLGRWRNWDDPGVTGYLYLNTEQVRWHAPSRPLVLFNWPGRVEVNGEWYD